MGRGRLTTLSVKPALSCLQVSRAAQTLCEGSRSVLAKPDKYASECFITLFLGKVEEIQNTKWSKKKSNFYLPPSFNYFLKKILILVYIFFTFRASRRGRAATLFASFETFACLCLFWRSIRCAPAGTNGPQISEKPTTV